MSVGLDKQIEGVLFYKAEPVSKRTLCTLLKVSDEELAGALRTLADRLSGATRLVETDREVELVTAPELDDLIDTIRKDEVKRDIGKAGAETLSIVLYRGPISRADIDRIRGVNSSFILRNLMMRGLVERSSEGRQNQYQVTTALLAHLGVTERGALPDYKETMDALDAYDREHATEQETV